MRDKVRENRLRRMADRQGFQATALTEARHGRYRLRPLRAYHSRRGEGDDPRARPNFDFRVEAR